MLRGTRNGAARFARVALLGMLGVAVVLPAAAGAAAPVPGTGKPPAGSGINTAAALDNPHCDKTAGPYGRLDFVQKGTGPVCVTVWKEGKDNGGATYQGVTKDKIKVVALVPNEQQMAAVTPNQLPMNYTTGKPGTVKDVFSDGLAGYEHAFGTEYTYGRDVELLFVTSTGSDEAAQRADAIAVQEMKPFAVLDAGTTDLAIFDTAMVRAKIPVFSLYVGVAATLEQAPYRWGQQDPVAGSMNAAEFIGKQLVGKKAQYAGDTAMHDKTRVFGIVRSEVIDIDFFNEAAKKYGVKVAPNANFSYAGSERGRRRSRDRAGERADRDRQAEVGRSHLGHPPRRRPDGRSADEAGDGAGVSPRVDLRGRPEHRLPGAGPRVLRPGSVVARVRDLERVARITDRADDRPQRGPVVLGAG